MSRAGWNLTAGRYYAGGCYARYVDEFRAMPLERLREVLADRAASSRAGGCYWPQANYSRALDRVARERDTKGTQ